MRILVTGADGLIGHAVVSKLLMQCNEVTGLYRQKASTDRQNKSQQIIVDLFSNDVLNIINKSFFDVVVHCAAAIPTSFEDDSQMDIANINKTIDNNIFTWCQKNGSFLIYLSTASVYGVLGGNVLINEYALTKPVGEYIKEKLWAEKQIQNLSIPAVIMRVNAPYGPRQKSQTVLKTFIERAIENKDLFYYGSGARTQDFSHCSDIANAISNIIEKKSGTGIYNISGGRPISMKDLAHLVVSLVPNCSSQVLSAEKPDIQEDYRALFDISKAKKDFGWKPNISLKDGIEEWISAKMK